MILTTLILQNLKQFASHKYISKSYITVSLFSEYMCRENSAREKTPKTLSFAFKSNAFIDLDTI